MNVYAILWLWLLITCIDVVEWQIIDSKAVFMESWMETVIHIMSGLVWLALSNI